MRSQIAEFCQNHQGNRALLAEMIQAAASSGFSHGKIQGLYSDELVKREAFEDPEGRLFRPFDRELERLEKLDLSMEDEAWFVEECIASRITPMITVFTHQGVERARKAGFRSIKIASYDCSSLSLIERVAEFADELVVSTGASTWDEVTKTAVFLRGLEKSGKNVGLLHARTVYPSKPELTGLGRMLALRTFGLPVGFSDHSRPDDDGLLASRFAIYLGAEILERHFTILDKAATKDGPVSINEMEAKLLSDFAASPRSRQLENLTPSLSLLGTYISLDDLDPLDEELVNREYYRGRVASTFGGKTVFSWEPFPID